MCRSSSTSSNDAESEAPGVQIGYRRSRSPGIRSEDSSASRARIQFRLPITVLISPLCAMKRNGCDSGQLGKVLVENREWTTATARKRVVEGMSVSLSVDPGGRRRSKKKKTTDTIEMYR